MDKSIKSYWNEEANVLMRQGSILLRADSNSISANLIKIFCAFTVFLFLSAGPCCCASSSKSAEKFSESYFEDAGNDKFYGRYNAMTCFKKHISIVSQCLHQDGSPFCYSQVIDLVDASKLTAISLSYKHLNKDGASNFIVDLTCVEAFGNKYLIVNSTNFSNCGTCEWIDLYTLDGSYLGSSGESSRDLPVSFRPINKDIMEGIFSKAAHSTETLSIDRNQ